ncbi:NIPSNAP family protein [Nonomuraea longicatena]|uniref:NIPSNAP family protein n=1 Tax=Nonomuraea longicatena TaxID=83682 RepID=A0ABN1NUJ5_9ACTN
MHDVRCPIVELRQYTLHPGQRDVLIRLFDREFIESQEAAGMTVLGQFRDLDDPDRFVWLRGFDDMTRRAEALGRFYGGPIWKTHREQANSTMIDSDDVLLLRPVTARAGFPPPAVRPPAGETTSAPSLVLATVYHGEGLFDQTFAEFFDGRMRPVLTEAGATPLAWLQSEHAANSFPALPVRTGENAFVWFARFADERQLAEHLDFLDRSDRWRETVLPTLSATLTRTPQRLRLTPTTRSVLR